MKKFSVFCLLLCLLLLGGCAGSSQSRDKMQNKTMRLATGQSGGAYAGLGDVLTPLLNQNMKGAAVKTVETNGSAANIELLRQKRAELALVQGDAAYGAHTGTESYQNRKMSNLQAIGTLFVEPVQIITYDVTGIRKLSDLKGKTVSVGAAGSGMESNAQQVLAAADITYDDLNIQYLSVADTLRALKEGTVDAAFVTSVLPTPALQELSRQRRLVFVPIAGQAAEELLRKYDFYQELVIPAGTYANQTEACPTVAVECLLVTTDGTSKENAHKLAETLYDHWNELRQQFPYLPERSLENILQNTEIPLTPGAEQFLTETEAKQ
mgnify:FL=1|jgi:TRAP transporter TAXI family solute receptor